MLVGFNCQSTRGREGCAPHRRLDSLIESYWIECGVENDGVDELVLIGLASLEVEEEGRLSLDDRPAQISAVAAQLVWRADQRKRIARIEAFVAKVEEGLAAYLVGAGLGEYLDASVAETFILRGEWISVDADFSNRLLRRQPAARKAVGVNLALALRPSRWPSQRLQRVGQIFRVVRQGIESRAADDDARRPLTRARWKSALPP